MKNITVIDDNQLICRALVSLLQKHGYKAQSLGDSTTAIAGLNDNVPDLVILDLMMPVVSGLEILAQMKQIVCLQTIKVIVYSAMDDIAAMTESLRLGAEKYVRKGDPWEFLYAGIIRQLSPEGA